jgi:hypothetical protein
MPKIEYKATLGPTHDKFGLRETKSSDAILIVDNASSDFSLKSITPEPSLLEPKQIFEIQNLSNRTHILSNTRDVLITDVVSDGVPLFYKIRRKGDLFDSITIEGDIHTEMDSQFIYTAMESGRVEYRDAEGSVILSEEGEFFPVFIWEGMVHLTDMMELDGKTLSYTTSSDKSRILIKCSKGNLTVEAKPGTIFDLVNTHGIAFNIAPFLYTNTKTVSGKRVKYRYDYSEVLPDVRSVSQDHCEILDAEYLQLSNRSIIKDSFKLTVIDPNGASGDITYEQGIPEEGESLLSVGAEDGSFNPANVNSTNGKVSIGHILREYDIDPLEYLFVASYSYVHFKDNSVTVDPEEIDLKYRRAVFYINPTEVMQVDSSVSYEPNISYTILEPNGSIAKSIDKSIPLYDFRFTTQSEDGEEVSNDATSGSDLVVGDAEESAWGEGGLGEGPFGGSYIKNIEDIRRLLEARENSVVGNIAVGEVDFTPDVVSASVFGVRRLSHAKESPVDELHLYSAGLWHQSVSGEHTETQISAGVSKYDSTGGVFIHGDKISEDSSTIFLEFNTERLSGFMSTTGTFDDSFVTTSPEVLYAASAYDSALRDWSMTADSFKLFKRESDGSILAIDGVLSYTFVDDLSKLIVSIPLIESGSTVGLGISNSTDNIYPTAFFKI